jgi:hypothetical protein
MRFYLEGRSSGGVEQARRWRGRMRRKKAKRPDGRGMDARPPDGGHAHDSAEEPGLRHVARTVRAHLGSVADPLAAMRATSIE